MKITFITPYREKVNFEAFKCRILDKFPRSQVIGYKGDDYGSFFGVWRKALPEVKNKYICLTHDDTEYLEIPDLNKYFDNSKRKLEYMNECAKNGEMLDQIKFEKIALEKIGMVGVAGTTVLHKDQPWWFSGERLLGRILSGQIYHRGEKENELSDFGPYGEVVVLDGVCMITTKEILEDVGIPEKDYGTFDFYDHILSLEYIKKGYKLLTVPIKMIHNSKGGDKRQSFYDSLGRFTEEYLDKTWRSN
jgi:hypothetical protein